MECPTCGTVYEQGGDLEDGFVRSICECEVVNKCFKCKRGQYLPVNQARYDTDLEVRYYACSKHGHIDAENYPIPLVTPPVTQSKKALVVVASQMTAPIAIPKEKPIKTPVELLAEWKEVKRYVLADMKGDNNKFLVECLNCKNEHSYHKRKIEFKDERQSIRILCPECEDGSYRIL